MSGPQKPVGSDGNDTVDMLPTVQGATDYFAIVNHEGRPTLCQFNQRGNQWRIMNQDDIQKMLQSAGASSNLMNMLR